MNLYYTIRGLKEEGLLSNRVFHRTVMKFIQLIIALFFVFTLGSVATAALETDINIGFPDLLADEFDDVNDLFDEYESQDFIVYDPLEPMNRVFFEFNDTLYEWLLYPVMTGYSWLVPLELRESFGNFFFNVSMPVRLLNTVLQGEFSSSGKVVGRFFINSTLGVAGLVDVAKLEWGIEPTRADFGQTLGRWGLGDGIYFCWPLVGPSNIRDSFGLVVDAYSHPIPYLHGSTLLDLGYATSNKLNTLSLHPTLYHDLKKIALDPYIASRQAYYEYRQAIIARN
jgi:phospholipid-binding lipoprotein MlaA